MNFGGELFTMKMFLLVARVINSAYFPLIRTSRQRIIRKKTKNNYAQRINASPIAIIELSLFLLSADYR